MGTSCSTEDVKTRALQVCSLREACRSAGMCHSLIFHYWLVRISQVDPHIQSEQQETGVDDVRSLTSSNFSPCVSTVINQG